MLRSIFLIAVVALVFLSGCIGVNNLVQESAQEYVRNTYLFNPKAQIEFTSINLSGVDPTCRVFSCENSTATKFFLFTETSLVGGNCSVESFDATNISDTERVVNRSKEEESFWIRSLGLGQGPTYADFNDALPYCGNAYEYVVQFIEGRTGTYVVVPTERGRSTCALNADVIPVYALYNKDRDSEGRAEPLINMGDLSGQLGGVGPVILISETAPKKDEATYQKLRQQIAVLKGACNNCLVFLGITQDEIYGPELNLAKQWGLTVNTPDRRFYLKKLQEDPLLRSLVDGVAFGIDSRFSEECDGRRMFLNEVLPLVSYINANLSLPSFIYYVYLPDTNKCKYVDSDYVKVYDTFFTLAPSLASQGLIGFAPQPYYEETSPFDCRGCAFTKKVGGRVVEAGKRFEEWFSRCDAYYKETIPPASVFGMDGNICLAASRLTTDYSIPDPTPEEKKLYNTSATKPSFFRCDSCLAVAPPDNQINALAGKAQLGGNACEATSETYEEANRLGLDGVIARATALTSSGNDRCYVEYSKTSGFRFDEVRGAYQRAGCGVLLPKYGSDCSSSAPNSPGEAACKVAAMGLFGFSYGPGEAYTTHPQPVARCGGNDFNPFDRDDAMCVFAEEFKDALIDAQNELNRLTVRGTYNRQLMLALLTAGEIRGNLARQVETFLNIREANRDCARMGSEARSLCCKLERSEERSRWIYTDRYGVCSKATFGEYISKLAEIPAYSSFKPAAENMEAYSALYKECEDCYSSEWFDNVCDAAASYGVFIRGCP